jgi:copper homeostasis protein (lipoprotein)
MTSHFARILPVLGTLLLLTGCSARTTKSAQTAHSSRNALDWPGAYTGTLPCADCEGIQTILQLRPDMTYSLATRYVGKSGATVQRNGTFSWVKAGRVVKLGGIAEGDAASQYQVGENKLTQLDLKGQRIGGALADRYVLQKSRTALTETYWKLVELNGKPVAPPATNRREAHLILKRDTKRVAGSGGCNSFGGSYELLTGNQIQFSKIAATRMACPDMSIEGQFFKVLETADSYTITGETLQLNRARMAPLARFEAVYLR